MGNIFSCTGLSRPAGGTDVVKLVHSNGLIEEFYRAVRVCELSVDYPHHSICESDDVKQFCNGSLRKLSEEESMQLGQIYFLLPSKALELPLTGIDVKALFSKANITRKASYKEVLVDMATQQVKPGLAMLHEGGMVEKEIKPSHAQLSHEQHYDVKISRELILKLIEETRLKLEAQWKQRATITTDVIALHAAAAREEQGRLPKLQSSYARHMLARSYTKLWRPSLETITEESQDVQ
ncbi:hypothetical protein KP509_14G027400 [Ceratopteris richardii]|uniref:Uncharacterized protein n=1 Tax=Ceratopteris richardii TaxID=49495 RepID=A0A8T2TAE4_CERRI|nr:hypothetical protein KP509_14G027400 [Ceratopteris richardii]